MRPVASQRLKPRDLIADSLRIIARVDLVHLVRNYEELVFRGGYYRGVVHDSLIVDPKSQKFWWNSQEGKWGSAVDWIMLQHGMSYKDAIHYLGDQMPGGRIPPSSMNIPNRDIEIPEIPLGEVIDLSRQMNPAGLDWWRGRGVYDEGLVANLLLGIDRCKSATTLPVWDWDERLTNVKHRSLLAQPEIRYWNHSKGRGFQLYDPGFAAGLGRVKPAERLVFVAGEIKAIVLLQNGIRAVSSTGGCGSFSEKWLPLFRARNVVVCFDPKETAHAEKMAARIGETAASTRVVVLEDDVDDLLNRVANVNERKQVAEEIFK